jgi:hypothetical protein
MPGTGCGLILIDMVCKPFAKILEKMPILMILFLCVLYAGIAYMVLKSAYLAEDHH